MEAVMDEGGTGCCGTDPTEDPDDSYPTELEDLPTLAMDKIVEFLDYRSRKTTRLVSRALKSSVDGTGLSAMIDSRDLESLKLCRKVAVTEAHVIFLKGQVNFKKWRLGNWKTAIFSGPIDTTLFFDSLLQRCSNLQFLMLRGDCLVSQDFSQSKALPVFQHLTELHLIVNQQAFLDALHKLGPQRNDQSSFRMVQKLDSRVQNNLGCLLKFIRSRVLKVFYVLVGLGVAPGNNEQERPPVRWEHEALFEFIQAHRNTLEGFMIPGTVLREAPLPQPVYGIPTKMKFFCSGLDNLCSKLPYWKDFLLAQTSFEKLYFIRIKDEPETVTSFFRQLITNSAATLTQISLTFRMEMPSLDMKMLKCCDSLKILHIDATEQPAMLTIYNLNEVPRSRMKILRFKNCGIGADFDGIKFMQGFNPSIVSLFSIFTEGFFENARYMAEFVKLLLRCRSLNNLWIAVAIMIPGFQLNDEVEVREHLEDDALIRWLSSASAEEEKTPNRMYLQALQIANNADLDIDVSSPLTCNDSEAVRIDCDYLALTSSTEVGKTLEQPFRIPRNADSYMIWMNQKTKVCRFQANHNANIGTLRVHDIQSQASILIYLLTDKR